MATKKGDVVAASPKEAKKPKKPLNRPPSRSIVRWCDELDRKLLLAIQSACNKCGVRIPWVEVALMMGSSITDGAIIQHLAKLRVRMVELGQDVPPPLRRSAGSAPKSAEAEEGDTPAPKPAATRKANSRKKGPKRSIYDTDDETYEEGKKPNNKKSKAKKGKGSSKENYDEAESVPIKIEEEAKDSGTISELQQIESHNDNADQDFVGGGEEFVNFEYQHSHGLLTPPNDEPSSHGETVITQEVIHDENVTSPGQASNGGIETSQFLLGNEAHPTQGNEAQTMSFANVTTVGNQQGFPMGISQAVPHAYVPRHELQALPTHRNWPVTHVGGNHFGGPQQFTMNEFDFIHGATNPNGAFTHGFHFPSTQGHLQHGARLPFAPRHSAPLNPAPISFTSSNTSLASSMTEDDGLMQAGVLDHDIDWALRSAREAEIENDFNEFIQQL
ncbi:conserved hypothetical protein [Trichophyton verrucosum HKI 0517]|uniref:Myb-like domain-containing protein n=1 Tax=Trichophyton verrucosum (strain HKI 0517) TaxID=663202 RepID=D4DFP0_TRIVH|nr:uncharacterized protein TRV_05991 [Trichophyton verrucosum HKI 0517]EFE39321.1 conserved hypothetical protein [Trichophyton verrucosum HKI 0517]